MAGVCGRAVRACERRAEVRVVDERRRGCRAARPVPFRHEVRQQVQAQGGARQALLPPARGAVACRETVGDLRLYFRRREALCGVCRFRQPILRQAPGQVTAAEAPRTFSFIGEARLPHKRADD